MDEKDFISLLKERHRAMYKLTFYMLGDEKEAKDATQEAFAKAWKVRSDLDFSTASAWLRKTAVNICIDLIRRRKFQAVPISDGPYETEVDWESNPICAQKLTALDDDPESSYIRKEIVELVRGAIERLPTRLKIAILLREMEGQSYEAVSQILQLPVGTVKSDIYRAKKLLRQMLHSAYSAYKG